MSTAGKPTQTPIRCTDCEGFTDNQNVEPCFGCLTEEHFTGKNFRPAIIKAANVTMGPARVIGWENE